MTTIRIQVLCQGHVLSIEVFKSQHPSDCYEADKNGLTALRGMQH